MFENVALGTKNIICKVRWSSKTTEFIPVQRFLPVRFMT